MVSVTISEGSLKVDAELLLERLRNTVKEFKDFFRLNLPQSFFEAVKNLKEDLNIAESVAMCEQLKREGKPIGEFFCWYQNYTDYNYDIFPINIQNEEEEQRNKKEERRNEKEKLLNTAPSGFFKPDLKSIVRIFDLIDLDMEINEDLCYDIKHFIKKYEIWEIEQYIQAKPSSLRG